MKRSSWGFRQRVCAFLFDGILRGHDQERLFQRKGRLAQRHLPLLHGFEQRGLQPSPGRG